MEKIPHEKCSSEIYSATHIFFMHHLKKRKYKQQVSVNFSSRPGSKSILYSLPFPMLVYDILIFMLLQHFCFNHDYILNRNLFMFLQNILYNIIIHISKSNPANFVCLPFSSIYSSQWVDQSETNFLDVFNLNQCLNSDINHSYGNTLHI